MGSCGILFVMPERAEHAGGRYSTHVRAAVPRRPESSASRSITLQSSFKALQVSSCVRVGVWSRGAHGLQISITVIAEVVSSSGRYSSHRPVVWTWSKLHTFRSGIRSTIKLTLNGSRHVVPGSGPLALHYDSRPVLGRPMLKLLFRKICPPREQIVPKRL
jgi:hypothetical protein